MSNIHFSQEKKGRDVTHALWQMSLYNVQAEYKNIKREHKDATHSVDYTTIADRLRVVSWSNYSHPTGWTCKAKVSCEAYQFAIFEHNMNTSYRYQLIISTQNIVKVSLYIKHERKTDALIETHFK